MDIKRTLLWAIFISTSFLLWNNWQQHEGKAGLFTPTSNSAVTSVETTKPIDASIPVASNPVKLSPTNEVSDVATQTLSEAKQVSVKTDLFAAEFSTQGAELNSLTLLQHQDNHHPGQQIKLFDKSKNRLYLAQTGLIGNNGVYPTHKTLMTTSADHVELQPDQEKVSLRFESAEQGGVKLIKTFTFSRNSYEIDIRHEIINVSSEQVQPALYLQLIRDGNAENESHFYSTFTGPATYTEAEKFQKIAFTDIEKGKDIHINKTDNGWIAMVQHYFVSAIIPVDKMQREVFTKKVDNNTYAIGTILPLVALASGAVATIDSKLYAGPQEETALASLAPGLELVKDYGWLTIIAKPLFWLLEKIHSFVGNWGWAIIVLTIFIKLIFFPLSAASYKSMAKMKQVTPKMQQIREQYAKEPAKMNQALMELYKTEKVNPFGGCLPILIQVPVFISLYWVLLASVEMRNAPWLGWIQDLASPDPWYVLPVLMAVTMFLQTRLNPTPPDPMQAKMMMIMPLVFSVMFFFFPSGLVLYYVVNNVLSILQQWQINRLFGEKKTAH